MGYLFISQLTNVNRFSKGETTENSHRSSLFYGVRLGLLSDQALIAAQAHTDILYLVQRGNREQPY